MLVNNGRKLAPSQIIFQAFLGWKMPEKTFHCLHIIKEHKKLVTIFLGKRLKQVVRGIHKITFDAIRFATKRFIKDHLDVNPFFITRGCREVSIELASSPQRTAMLAFKEDMVMSIIG